MAEPDNRRNKGGHDSYFCKGSHNASIVRLVGRRLPLELRAGLLRCGLRRFGACLRCKRGQG